MLRFLPRATESTHFPRPETMPEALHLLLSQRGIDSEEAADRFLHPDASQLHDPFLLSDMERAVSRIQRALDTSEHICVYGDYDVDGVCASAILYLYLKSQGVEAEVYLPSRHHEGYGLNDAAMQNLAERNTLMITVDCGISCGAQVALAQRLGMDCVVTDHHRPGDTLPDCPTVNPLLNDYPFPALCGAGVAFHLVCALGGLDAAMPYADLAALATVADLVSLTGENRVLVHLGLEKLNRVPRTGIQALLRVSGMENHALTAGNVAFQLAPRLNAGGRLGDARRSFELLTEASFDGAMLRAEELERENTLRKDVEQQIVSQAEAQLESFDFPRHRIMVLWGEGWNPGVIGLGASRLTEKYNYPSILLAVDGDTAIGSCRSIPEVDIYQALCGVSDLFQRFGGHKQAAGLTMPRDRIPELQRRLDEALFAAIPPEAYIPRAEYDLELPLSRISEPLVRLLDDMQPTGFGNPAPVFLARVRVEEARSVGADGAHLKLRLCQNNRRMDGIRFREGHRAKELLGQDCDMLFTPKLNAFGGRVSVQAEAKALEIPSDAARLEAILPQEEEFQSDFLTEMLYNRDYILPQQSISLDALLEALHASPQGTLVLMGDARDAVDLADALSDAAFDLSVGRYPGDPRAFNALCVYPAGKHPRNYARVVLAGIPWCPLSDCENVQRLNGFPVPEWLKDLPDVHDLREVLRALIAASRRPCFARTRQEMCCLAAAGSGRARLCAQAAIAALEDMRLISVEEGAVPCFRIQNAGKTDPMNSAMFQRILALKQFCTEGGAGG